MKKIRIIADSYVFSLQLLVMAAGWVCTIILTVMLADPTTKWRSEMDEMFAYPLIWLPLIICTCISLFWDTRWANVLVLDRENIELRSCFKKPVAYEYREFPYIYRAGYRHSMVGAPDFGPVIVYIVLSRRQLTDFEKTHINQVNSTTDLIKIKFNQKRYRLLLENMPPKLSRELERTFARFL